MILLPSELLSLCFKRLQVSQNTESKNGFGLLENSRGNPHHECPVVFDMGEFLLIE